MSKVNHSFVQMTKLNNVRGRVRYISDPKRQENLYATYSNVPDRFWYFLSNQNQRDFERSGTEGTCIEARELILMLPPSLIEYDHDALLGTIVGTFTSRYNVGCAAALHHNKKKTNLHVHLIFSEREMLEKPEAKIATRNRFYDETGKHVRTKKEILDEEGNIRSGCTTIKKGEVYETNFFKPKDPVFKSKEFLNQMKEAYTEQFNNLSKDEKEKLKVFTSGGPYLATRKIGKNNPLEKEIKTDNYLRKEWNHMVDRSLIVGLPEESIMGIKKKTITNKVSESMKKYGENPRRFTAILQEAIGILRGFMERFKKYGDFKVDRDGNVIARKKISIDATPATLPPREKGPYPYDISEKEDVRRLREVYGKLADKNNQIESLENDIKELKSELAEIKPHMIFRRGKKRELSEAIESKEFKIEELKSDIELIPTQYGLANVLELNRAYHKAMCALEDVQRRQREWNTSDSKPDKRITKVIPKGFIEESDKKERVEERAEAKEPQSRSIKDRLKENQELVDENKRTKRKRSVDREDR